MKRAWIAAVLIVCAGGLGAVPLARATPLLEQPGAPATDPARILVMLRLPPEHYRPQSDYAGSYGENPSRIARQRLARRIAHDHHLTLLSDWPMPLIGLDCFVMEVRSGQTAETVATEVSRDRRVEWSQPLQEFEAKASAARYNDPLLAAEPAVQLWHLPELHQLATGRGIVVAVIDSKIDAAHADLSGQLSDQKDFVINAAGPAEQHGTAVAGIIGARGNNRIGIVGIAPGARLMALRACRQVKARTTCDSLSLAKALHYAIEHRADVINLSLAGPNDRLLTTLLQTAIGRGRTVVAAYDRMLPAGGFPASLEGIIAVSDEPVVRARPGVYTAPGRGVPTTQVGGRWHLVDGSSFAAAHVSGLVALAREHGPRGKGVRLLAASPGGEIDACGTISSGIRNCECCPPGRSAAVR
jgi:subtilisin family serine protease